MIQISNEELEQTLTYESLIPRLREAFTKEYNFPKRHHHQYPNPTEGMESTLLLMPAWDNGEHLGVKIVNVSPNNSRHGLPTIQGLYLLFDVPTGTLRAQMDAKILTNKRTAAASALASSYLSRPESNKLLVVGTGALSAELIKAHLAVRPIQEVMIWGRDFDKAQQIADQFLGSKMKVYAVENLETAQSEADIITCATLSPDPLIFGKNIRPGQHYDMIGAYKPDMREADDAFITSVAIHVDTVAGASTETGDLAIPLSKGIISLQDLHADLFQLCKGIRPGRTSAQEITCFKSVGHALEDLAAASLVYETVQSTIDLKQ